MSSIMEDSRDMEAPDEIPMSPPAASDDPVHDQLPSVEEIRMTASKSGAAGASVRSAHNSRTPWVIFSLIILVLIGIIIGLSVGLAKKDEEGREPRYETVKLWLFENQISSGEDLDRPEWDAAVRWIADQDRRYLPLPLAPESDEGIEFVNRYVTALIYFTMDGENWDYRLNFLDDSDVCVWNQMFTTAGDRLFRIGANCDIPGRVTELHILGNSVKGTIPPEIQHLKFLEFLALNGNQVSGSIPSELRSLTLLYYIALHYNDMTGSIPDWIGELSNLRVLGLGENQMSGEIPRSIGDLTDMVTLGLDHNAFSGDLDMLYSLTRMKRLYIEDNLFDQEIDDSFFSNANILEDLDVSDNEFTGTLPPHLLSHPSLKILDFGENDLSGTIPSFSATSFYPMIYLGLHANDLTGDIPAVTLSNFKNATHIDLSGNDLGGTIPNELALLTKLSYLFLANNENLAPGAIPTVLGSITSLVDLSLKNTARTGEIPTELGMLSKLILLDLDNNGLVGSMPSEIGNLRNLRFLLLNRNELDGSMPNEFEKLSYLEMLLLDRNKLTGTAEPVCRTGESLRVITADCDQGGDEGEVDCSCCTFCCQDNEQCHDEEYLGGLDPSWEHSFARAFYEFSPTLIFDSQQENRRDYVIDP